MLTAVQAQKGNNQFIPSLEIGLPTGSFKSYKTGVGVSGKALIGVGENGQVGFSTGYSWFKQEGSTDANKVKTTIVPILIGYRYRLPVVYIESQVGYGFYTTTIKTQISNTETKSSDSNGGFTWTIGGGVQLGNVDLGVHFQAGYPSGDNVEFFGFQIGYVFRSKQ
jgi:hypothetical protein